MGGGEFHCHQVPFCLLIFEALFSTLTCANLSVLKADTQTYSVLSTALHFDVSVFYFKFSVTHGAHRLQARTETLKKALAARGVDSRRALLEQWKEDPKCACLLFCWTSILYSV